MVKGDIIYEIAVQTKLSPFEVMVFVDKFCLLVKEALGRGETVHINEWGKFYIQKRAARKGQDIFRGEKVIIPARNIVRFRPSKALKERVLKLPME